MTQKTPTIEARELLRKSGFEKPSDIGLLEFASSEGIHVKYEELKGSEGRIIMYGDNALVTINSSINNSGKRNFVLAHEIGHFKLHQGIGPLFSDTNRTLSDWYRNGKHEQEANEFASELLMPSRIFSEFVSGEKLDFELIEDAANYFDVSLTATFLKYCSLGDYPLMVIYIEDKLVKWTRYSQDFAFQYIEKNSNVSPLTVAGDFFQGNGIEDSPVLVKAIEWFPDDFEIKKKQNWQLWEQCFQVSTNGIIACLWTF